MTKKSKFLTFILSFVPGLGHIYLGLNTRGAIFLLAEIAIISIMIIIGSVMNIHDIQFLGILIPVIWLAALIDSMVLADKINKADSPDSLNLYDSQMVMQNKKALAMVLSVIPGAGHMYLGLQRQGLQLMSLFFLCFFLTDWLRIGLFMVFVPIIWFFSIFDAMHKSSEEGTLTDNNIIIFSWFKGMNWSLKNTNKFLAYGLIILGCYLLFEKVALPEIEKLIEWEVRDYLQNIVVAALFIFGGVKLLMGSKNPSAL